MIDYDTTRRFSRSMAQAFPDVRAHCIELPEARPGNHPAINFMLAVAAVFLVVLLITERFV